VLFGIGGVDIRGKEGFVKGNTGEIGKESHLLESQKGDIESLPQQQQQQQQEEGQQVEHQERSERKTRKSLKNKPLQKGQE